MVQRLIQGKLDGCALFALERSGYRCFSLQLQIIQRPVRRQLTEHDPLRDPQKNEPSSLTLVNKTFMCHFNSPQRKCPFPLLALQVQSDHRGYN
jgi:hypothetical protein